MPTGVYERTPEIRERLRQVAGRPETREKIRQAMFGNKHHLGHKHSPETRERIRQTRLGQKASPEMIERNRQAQCRPEVQEKKRQATFRQFAKPENRERKRQQRLRQKFPHKMTTIERLLRDEFRKRRLHFEMHKTMFGRFQPDFVFEQAHLIVQADGDYWHSRPEVRKRDAAFNEAAKAGWTVWRFGGREIEMHAAACARAVARFVRDH